MAKDTLRNEFAIRPDELHYRFIKTIEVAGVFAIPDRASILSSLEPGMRLKFVRESKNSHDANALV